MYPFTYHRASGIDDALARLAADPDAKLISGGMTLLPAMKHRLAAPSQLVDLGRLPELRGISVEGATLVVGAATRHREIADDAQVRARQEAELQEPPPEAPLPTDGHETGAGAGGEGGQGGRGEEHGFN